MDNAEPRPRQIESIKRSDMKPDVPQPGGTTIILQRHEAYVRDKDSLERGALTQEGKERALQQSHDVMFSLLEQIPAEDRDSVSVMVFASPTHLGEGKKKRAVETGEEVLKGIKRAFQEEGVAEFRPLNDQERFGDNAGRPVSSRTIVEPQVFNDPKQEEFFEWMKARSGGEVNQAFFKEFEEDEGEVHDKRIETNAEGPREMADRVDTFLNAITRYSDKFHQANPGRRLILWPVSHYDLISPWVKTRINNEGIKRFLDVEMGSGVSFTIAPNKVTSAKIGDERYPIDLVKASTAS